MGGGWRRREWLAALVFISFLAGCGETVRGVSKDVSRVGRGVKTIFVSDR